MDAKSKQLGMPFGTANGKLRKAILFKYIKKCKDDICFKCNLIIETVEELSIEHKKPWQGKNIELFWDLSNIAFSHLKCNIKEKVYPNGREHGRNKYDLEGCRCDKCRQDRMTYQKTYRNENKERLNKKRRELWIINKNNNQN